MDVNNGKLKDPSTTYDYMSYCGWPSEVQFAGKFLDLAVDVSAHIYADVLTPAGLRPCRSALLDPARSSVAWYYSITPGDIMILPWVVARTTISALGSAFGTAYCLEAQDDSGVMLVRPLFRSWKFTGL